MLWFFYLIVVPLLVILGPLFASFLEILIFHSNHIADMFDVVENWPLISNLYEWIFELLG